MSMPTDLLARVTRRLFISISSLLAGALLVMSYALSAESHLVVPAVVVIAGIIGGFVGLQRRLKDLTVEDLTLISTSHPYTWLSPIVGGVLALLLYVLFLSGLLSGQLFPQFEADALLANDKSFKSVFQQHAKGYSEYAKLVFWCFVAGFSERFVTDVIGRFEGAAIRTLPQQAANTKESD
jgi:hypothetical protein